jgi:hypothetical protein
LIQYSNSIIEYKDKKYEFPDCVETTLRNLINIFIYDKNTRKFDLFMLKKLNTYIDLNDYYNKYNNLESQLTDQARNTWAQLITENINKYNIDNEKKINFNKNINNEYMYEIDANNFLYTFEVLFNKKLIDININNIIINDETY